MYENLYELNRFSSRNQTMAVILLDKQFSVGGRVATRAEGFRNNASGQNIVLSQSNFKERSTIYYVL